MNELGLLSYVSARGDTRLELPAIVLAIANRALLAETQSERIDDAIKKFNKAWIGSGCGP